jgi:lipopolysaccharide/colanic/teichoic acid biosynthesis glycosyltransferase
LNPPPEEVIPLDFQRMPSLTSLALKKAGWLELKYSLDTLFAIAMFIVCLPVLAICILLVKLTSKGPVFFKQRRVGQDGRFFEILKLRTMRVDAEADTGPVWARENDPRVTRFGRFLRKTHLDELPQLINVIRGDMSLVGPRPERPVFVNHFRDRFRQYDKRISVRPGITGLAQVCYKYDETHDDVRKKLAYDLLYLRKMCMLLDMSIIFLTLGRLTGKGAK